jgi:hypothetical protein
MCGIDRIEKHGRSAQAYKVALGFLAALPDQFMDLRAIPHSEKIVIVELLLVRSVQKLSSQAPRR